VTGNWRHYFPTAKSANQSAPLIAGNKKHGWQPSEHQRSIRGVEPNLKPQLVKQQQKLRVKQACEFMLRVYWPISSGSLHFGNRV
jgi:hypothetical protein